MAVRKPHKAEMELAVERLRAGASIDGALGAVASEFGRAGREAVARALRVAVLERLGPDYPAEQDTAQAV